ncbi:unannotated protein [freshwater metagenome]|uniref:Unannotated protein n=1 Tax=freshwater metagenome TaxID=449393 RepID=A0A6J6NU09_9ZZZZ
MRWSRNVSAGAWILRYPLPKRLAPGRYRINVIAQGQDMSRSLSIPVRLTHAAIRAKGKPTVLVVSSGAPRSLPHLSLGAQAKVSVTTAWETADAVFTSRSVAAVVVNVDTQSIALVHSIHILYPNVQIVAVTSDPKRAVRARRFGASAVVLASKNFDAVLSGTLSAIVAQQFGR